MIFTYNKIVKNRNQIDFALKNIDVQLKKRYDALPNLVAVLKKYLSHEESLFTDIARLRTAIENSSTKEDKIVVEKELSSLLGNVQFTLENYPELKSNKSVIHVQRSINEFAEQISASQRAHNAAVLSYNNSITVFPNNVIAKIFSFRQEDYVAIITNRDERKNMNISELL